MCSELVIKISSFQSIISSINKVVDIELNKKVKIVLTKKRIEERKEVRDRRKK